MDMDFYYLISQQHLKLPMHNFTSDDLLQYLYQETSTEKSAAIKEALESDWSLTEVYQALVKDRKRLDEVNYSPRSKTIADIMSYAEESIEKVAHPA